MRRKASPVRQNGEAATTPAVAKKRTGRPSKFTQTLADEICRRLASGESLDAICRSHGFPDASTVWDWTDRNESFASQYARARAKQADTLAEEILAIADGAAGKPNEEVQAARLRVDARKWFASKVAPRKYGDRVAADVSGSLSITVATGVPDASGQDG